MRQLLLIWQPPGFASRPVGRAPDHVGLVLLTIYMCLNHLQNFHVPVYLVKGLRTRMVFTFLNGWRGVGKDYFVTFENYIEIRFQYDQIKVLGTQLALCLQGASVWQSCLQPLRYYFSTVVMFCSLKCPRITKNSIEINLKAYIGWGVFLAASTWKRFVVFVCHLMTLHSNGCCMGFRSQSTEKCLRTCVCVLGGEERAACQVWEFWTIQSYFQAVFPSWGFRNSKLILRISVKFLALQWSGLSFL